MNFINLKYFLTIAEEKSYIKAARKLFISPQALNGHMRRLEEEIGTELFEKTSKVNLTYAGQCFKENAYKIMDIENQMTAQISDIINNKSGKLSIGTSHTRGRVLLPDLIPQYIDKNPSINLSMECGITQDLEIKLIDGDIDLLIGFLPFHNRAIKFFPIRKERLCLVVPKKLVNEDYIELIQNSILNGCNLTNFSNLPFLMMKSGRIFDMVKEYSEKNKIRLNIILEHSDLETLLGLCIKGIGITFTFESYAKKALFTSQKDIFDKAYIIPFDDTSLQTELVIAYNGNRYLSRPAADFIALAKSLL